MGRKKVWALNIRWAFWVRGVLLLRPCFNERFSRLSNKAWETYPPPFGFDLRWDINDERCHMSASNEFKGATLAEGFEKRQPLTGGLRSIKIRLYVMI